MILLAAAQFVRAQAGGDAGSLVRDVSAVALAAKTWRAEGTLVRRGADGKDDPPLKFRMAFQLPRYARYEVSGGDLPFLRICDGQAQRTYYPDLKGFVRVILPQIGPCAYPLNAWPPLAQTLAFPALSGTDTITVDGHPQPCQIVRAALTWSSRDPAVKETVTLCIDREHKRILRYQLQHSNPAPAWAETYTFSLLEIDPTLEQKLFDFQAPEGSRPFATIDWLTPIAGIPAGVFQVSNAVSAPILTDLVPPLTPSDAALVEGGNTVLLHVQIGRDGVPRGIEVIRSLGQGMDEAAVNSVKQWRFKPGENAAGPAPVAATIYVHFMQTMAK